MTRGIKIIFVLLIAAGMISACICKKEKAPEPAGDVKAAPAATGEGEKPQSAAPAPKSGSSPHVAETTRILDTYIPAGGATNDQGLIEIADDYAGINKTVGKDIGKDIFLIYAGAGNTYNLKASKPATVITIYGSENTYNVTKAAPFDGEVFFVTLMGTDNKYTGADKMTVEEFRDKY